MDSHQKVLLEAALEFWYEIHKGVHESLREFWSRLVGSKMPTKSEHAYLSFSGSIFPAYNGPK